MSPSPARSNPIPIRCHLTSLFVHFRISACARPTRMHYIHSCLFGFISFGLIELSCHSMTRLDHFVVFCMVPTYPWRGNVLFLSPWCTWLPLDISLIRRSPGYSLDYKILVVWWIENLSPMCTDHPFLAAKPCLCAHRHFSHTWPSS